MNTHKRLAAVLALVCAVGCAAASTASASGVIVSPQAGTAFAMPGTQISFLGAARSALSRITVTGSRTGAHSGHLRSYSSATGTSFIPNRPFAAGERVIVRATWRPSRRVRRHVSTVFTVAAVAKVPLTEFPAAPGTPADVQSFQSEPSLHPPVVTVHQAAGAGAAPGYLLAAPFLGPGQWGPMIFDSAGNLVWFKPVPPGEDAADLRTQTFHGRDVLTWWQGRTITLGYGLGEDVIADANYRVLDVVRAGNGLQADEHEFNITPQGTAYVLAYSPVQTSLAAAGGPSSGIVLDGVIQEVDIHTGLVMWEWHSLGHVDLSESYSKLPGLATNAFDYFHINSVETDVHGNLLVSARNTWAIYDVNHHTGAVMWRLGGKRSTFTLGPGVSFAYQHNALWLPNGDISLFDDEGAPPIKPPSRGIVLKLDTRAKTATLVSQFIRTTGPLITTSQGNTQSLPGGGWMVGWGGLPNFTEFNAQGQVIYDAQLPRGEDSYRVYRLPWAAQPATPPALAVKPGGESSPPCPPGSLCPVRQILMTAYASWNGATTVASWQLLSGPAATQLTPVSTTPRSGFETMIPASSAAFYQVRALSASGRVLATSKVVAPGA
jgi:hypothetical protein